jgi:diguanylate cyclase (GGDEF)-like protein
MSDMDHKESNTGCILAVDDEKTIRDLIKSAMEFAKYKCVIAESALDALQILSETKIDVVVTDIMMPHMDGMELTAIIREKYDTDVIVMTGYSEDFTYEQTIAKGASDFIQKPISITELIVRVKRVLKERALLMERNRAEEALRESERRFQELSITDGLTNLYNSRHFYGQLQMELDRFSRYKRPLTLMLLDIDDFKLYNDSYGHLEGDGVLAKLAEVIQRSLRKTDSAYRYGGEEFVIMLPETSAEQGHIIAERIRQEFRDEPFQPEAGQNVHVTVSIGVTQYIQPETLTAFINRADKCMYKAKRQGKDQVFCSLINP